MQRLIYVVFYPDFVYLINQYHIFSICETKLDNFDIPDNDLFLRRTKIKLDSHIKVNYIKGEFSYKYV